MDSENTKMEWGNIYRLGGMAAIGAVLVGMAEIAIQFLPGAAVVQQRAADWFALFQQNWFFGLRNMGLLNIFLNLLAIFTYFALYAAHRKTSQRPYAALALIISLLGIAVFFATNRAFPMWELSRQYALAVGVEQKAILEAAGQAMLSVGASHSPGTFISFFLVEAAGVMISLVMLRGKVFSKVAAYAGIFGFAILLIFEYLTSFISGLTTAAMMLSMFGGLLSMLWYILIARKFFAMARRESALT